MKYCVNCGAQIDLNAEICPKCGVRVSPPPQPTIPVQAVSDAWYLVPILFAIIGGLIAYVVIKDKDSKKATNMIIVGILSSILWFIIAL